MATVRGRRKQVRFRKRDVSLTGAGGVVALAELVDRLGVVGALDAGIGPVKQRGRMAFGIVRCPCWLVASGTSTQA